MLDQLVAAIVDESKWLTASLALALAAAVVFVARQRSRGGGTRRALVLATLTLFFGVTIGTMAFGHLLAVSVELFSGTLVGSTAAFYAIGLALAVPAGLLVRQALHLPASAEPGKEHGNTRTIVLNGWLALTLLVLGPQNFPLALPGLLNIAYALHSRPAVGWSVVALAAFVNIGLFVGSLVFLASGQSFEQFRGMEP
jgi:hypothetical protein